MGDYISNHDSSSRGAAAAWMSWEMNKNWVNWAQVSFDDSVWTVYCVELLLMDFSEKGQYPMRNEEPLNGRFADYASCNGEFDGECHCNDQGDRGGSMPNGASDCVNGDRRRRFKPNKEDCCSDEAWNYSMHYVSAMNLYSGDAVTGQFFSTPMKTECPEGMKPGDIMKDGTQCTWQRQPAARVFKGYQIKEAGGEANNIDVNIQAMGSLVDGMPLTPWQCGDGAAARLGSETAV